MSSSFRKSIVFCVDSAFFPYAVACTSIIRRNNENLVDFYILTTEAIDGNLRQNLPLRGVTIIDVSGIFSQLKRYPSRFGGFSHISDAMYCRLIIAEVLDHLDWCLYLDVDTLPLVDFDEIFSLRDDSFSILGVNRASHTYLRSLGFLENDLYVNSGVLLMNLSFWRTNHVKEGISNWLDKNRDSLFHPDQDAINFILKGTIGILPQKFNINPLDPEPNTDKDLLESRRATRDDAIFHFWGPFKPWSSSFDLYWQSLWSVLSGYRLKPMCIEVDSFDEAERFLIKSQQCGSEGLFSDALTCIGFCDEILKRRAGEPDSSELLNRLDVVRRAIHKSMSDNFSRTMGGNQ